IYSELYLNDIWTIKKIENYVASFYSYWKHYVFEFFVGLFDLPFNKMIKTLYMGMKMKLFIAIAFTHQAELFILDEPNTSLESIIKNEVLDIIQKELIDERKTVFLSTHIISDLEKIDDYLVYIKDGEVVLNDFLDHLLSQFKIVKGDSNQIDEELMHLTQYFEINKTGYTALTTQ